MTIEEVDKILPIWGKYLEYTHGRLVLIFSNHIPESFLPFSKDVLRDTFDTAKEQYCKSGNKRGVELMQESTSSLMWYEDDGNALSLAAEELSDSKRRSFRISILKDGQKNWIKTQDI